MELYDIPKLFGIDDVQSVEEINNGHINRTYLCHCSDKYYIMQSINNDVFSSPERVMNNVGKIVSAFEMLEDERVAIPEYIHCGEKLFAAADGQTWRMYRYIPEKVSPLTNSAYSTGLAYGTFIRAVNAKGVKLNPTITDFHDLGRYFSTLTNLAANSGLKKIDSTVITKLGNLKETLEQVFTADFKRRNVHNDAKTDNVIIGESVTIIDLDTAMPGYAAIDYGNLIRSVCKGKAADMNVIRDATRGFAAGLRGVLSSDETDSLYYGILYVTGELAIRYLIDYISEDGYFKGKTPAQCLGHANDLLEQLGMFIQYGEDIINIIYSAFEKK